MYQTYVYDKISDPSYSKELHSKKILAKKGDINAQVEYGTAHFYGIKNGSKQIVREDPVLALEYAKNTSNQGNPDGFVLYGLMQLYGHGKVKKVPNAFNSFLSAIKVDSNHLDAQFLLSYIFFEENYKQLDQETSFRYLQNSGINDKHKEKRAMHYLGKIYYDGIFVPKDDALSIRFLSISAESYPPSQELLKECTKILTKGSYSLNYNSKMKNVYESEIKIRNEGGNITTPVVEELFRWAQKNDYPPAIYECAMINISRGIFSQLEVDQLKKSTDNFYLPAIDQYIFTLLNNHDNQNAMIYSKHSIYFKSNRHQTTIAEIYKKETSSIDPGIYFRYRKYADQFDEYDNNLINKIKMNAQQNGSPEELFCYAICLENGFAGLQADPETAVQLYKKAADNGCENVHQEIMHILKNSVNLLNKI